MSKFGDPTFDVHATVARIGAAMLLRIANAEILPYDYVEFARTMRRFGSQVDQAIADKRWNVSSAGLSAAITRMETAAVAFNTARDRALTAQLAPGTAKQVNASLLKLNASLQDRRVWSPGPGLETSFMPPTRTMAMPRWFCLQ
jgi:N-acetylated-alpha-linked acidic dipeptidase